MPHGGSGRAAGGQAGQLSFGLNGTPAKQHGSLFQKAGDHHNTTPDRSAPPTSTGTSLPSSGFQSTTRRGGHRAVVACPDGRQQETPPEHRARAPAAVPYQSGTGRRGARPARQWGRPEVYSEGRIDLAKLPGQSRGRSSGVFHLVGEGGQAVQDGPWCPATGRRFDPAGAGGGSLSAPARQPGRRHPDDGGGSALAEITFRDCKDFVDTGQ